ncbi:glycosyltransferase [Desulfovibrio sp. OttesenSCG-928-A18]|nr:glycosyltransferase [Desulfovibrio sp. OttesenSCG-928-A18]
MSETRPRLRVMQILPLYNRYLAEFYGLRPRLSGLSSEEQTRILLRDGCSAVHVIAPHLPPELVESAFVVPNCRHIQRAWAEENGLALQAGEGETALLLRRIEHFRPDVLYMGDPVRYDSRFIRKLAQRPDLVLGWRAADVPHNIDWSAYDGILSGLPWMLRLAPGLGAKEGIFFLPGLPPGIAREVAHISKDIDVVFAGGASPGQHGRRLAVLEALALGAARHGFSFALHLSCPPALVSPAMRPYAKKALFGLAMYKTLARGRIVVNARGEIGLLGPQGERILDLAQGHSVDMRLFESTACGALLLTDQLPGLSELFEPGREIVCYTDSRDMLDKTLYYLAHERERSILAASGRKRCLASWNMGVAVRSFMDILASRLPGKLQGMIRNMNST